MTRHELKDQLQHDQFTDTVSSVVSYSSSHRQTIVKYSIIGGIALIIAALAIWFSSYRTSIRQADLQAAFSVLDVPVGAPPGGSGKSFATQDEKTKAAEKAFGSIVATEAGSHEGQIAQYYLGTLKAQAAGDSKGAEADLSAVSTSSGDVGSLAKIALAQLYLGQKKTAQAENLLRDVVNKPTTLVSKTQAQVLLAQMLASTNPRESKKILQSLRVPNQSPAVTRALDQVSSQEAK